MTARITLLLVFLLSFSGSAVAQGVDDELDAAGLIEEGSIMVIQPKSVLVRHRVEVLPRIGVTINDPLIRQFDIGGSLYYFFSESLFVGPTFQWFDFEGALGGPTEAYADMIRASSSIPQLAPLTYVGSLDVGWIPLNGKFAFFNSAIVCFDLFVSVGGGLVESATEIHPAASVAIGQRLFLTDWLTLVLELRDRIYFQPYTHDSTLMNIISVGVGVGFFIPPSFSYMEREDRLLDWD